jgi:hypothetical protein
MSIRNLKDVKKVERNGIDFGGRRVIEELFVLK